MSYADCCEQGRDTVRRHRDGDWYVKDVTYKYFDGIKFCPFCGHDLNAPATLREALALLLTNPYPLRLVFDVDGVCADDRDGRPYVDRKAYEWVPETMRDLKRAGHTLIFATARYMAKYAGDQRKAHEAGWQELKFWLDCNGIPWDEICLGKPSGDLYPDDRGCRIESNRGSVEWATKLVPAVLAAQAKKRS